MTGIAGLLEEIQASTAIRIDLFIERARGDECFILDDAPAVGESFQQTGFSVSVRHSKGTGHAAANSLSRDGIRHVIETAAGRAAADGLPTGRLTAALHQAVQPWGPSPAARTGQAPGPAWMVEPLRAAHAAARHAPRGCARLASVATSYSGVARDFVRLAPARSHLEGAQQRYLVSCRAIADGAGGAAVGYRKAGVRELDAWASGHDIIGIGREAGRAALAKRGAEAVDERNATLVIGAGASGVLAHELLGHPLEGDVVAHGLAGVDWRKGDRIGPAGLNVIDDPGFAGGWGSYAYDDEGAPAHPRQLVRDGVVVALIEGAGRQRRQSFRHLPLCRMSNVRLENGRDDPAALTASVAHGYQVSRLGGGAVREDGTFSLGAVDIRRIRNGVPAEPMADAVVTGEVAAVLMGIQGIGTDFAMGSPASCAKYGQEVPVGDGGPTVLVTGVTLQPSE
ncbi:TldD/PmbA family protein [Streptomyces sp. P9-2B-2]|uniref:TldD/PmbA family protein n=1 Tax=Streptomyces sp. P9-2B-2 TaxID=3057114 RepID=UPI0025B34993|nr:TldD/PmbA family protein [Streptomyces sp. P9-2B-2]WJY35812.1 TldD/PmbA family protein [Streptomyces sp. P9-2B-2]